MLGCNSTRTSLGAMLLLVSYTWYILARAAKKNTCQNEHRNCLTCRDTEERGAYFR